MKPRILALQTHPIIVALMLLAALPVGAQIVADGATNTLSNITNTFTGDVTVGTNGSFTLLRLSDNSLLTNSGNGLIGRSATAKSNEVQLLSASARWRMGGLLYIGSNGAASRLIVDNGALVENNSGTLGFRLESSNNFALITGGGSLWTNRNNLDIGSLGRGNQMIVSNGGWVASRNVRVGVDSSSSNNLVLVTGSGSVWSNALSLSVGNIAAGNRLVIEAGGLVNDDTGVVGDFNSASNNEALVTGPGSLWINRSGLGIGNQIGYDRLVVSNGGAVWSGQGSVGSFSNQVVVTGAGSVWSNQTSLFIAGRSNRVDVSNGGWLADASGYIAGKSNTVMLAGSGSGWNNSDSLLVGDFSDGNTLIASSGATVLSSNAFVGSSTSLGNNNLAIITGAGTLWNNRNDFVVGNFSFGNRLVATNGATMTTSNLFIGFNASATNNRVSVDGGTLRANVLDVRRGAATLNAGLTDVDFLRLTNAQGQFEFNGGTLVSRGAFINNGSGMIVGASGSGGGVWDVRAGTSNHVVALDVVVGNFSPFNQLLITGGALLTNGIGAFIGVGAGGNSNAATVAGAGSQWQTAGDFTVGSSGSFSRLAVSNSGWVVNASGLLGAVAGASNNEVRVTGPGSTWSNRADVVVGQSGSGNRLLVDNGAVVSSNNGEIGHSAASSDNLAVVSGSGSTWNNSIALTVGVAGSGNQLLVSNGGFVVDLGGRIGVSGSSNLARVTGVGSIWSNRFGLNVGDSGSGDVNNRLLVEDGGQVFSGDSTIGVSGRGNLALVTGSGSRWRSPNLLVGATTRGSLVVSSGGAVLSDSSSVGASSTLSSFNLATVTGPGSLWSNQLDLVVGPAGPVNALVVSNGGWVVSGHAVIGGSSSASVSASNNLVTVTGAGSVWSNRADLIVGLAGDGNQLVAANGGTIVAAGNALIGREDGANANSAWVTDPGTRWLVANNLFVGSNGAFNLLVVSNSGTVFAGNVVVGAAASAINNRVVVDGGTLRPTNLYVGSNGPFNLLVVSNGGTVFGGNIIVGATDSATNNRMVVDGGILRATNVTSTSMLDVRRGTNVLNAGLVDVDQLVLTNKGTTPIPNVFGNSSSNHIPANGITGPASAYPSTIAVAGLAGLVTKVSVTLSNLTYEVPRNLDILLVSPAGQKVMLMSDAGSGFSVSNVRLTFDDTAATLLPPENSAPITSGTYRPTDYEPGDTMPSPAPAGPYSTNLSSFNGISPNGDWSLYITRDSVGAPAFTDSLVGWGLQIEIEDLFFDPAVFEFNGGTLITRGASINNGLPFVLGGPGGIPAIWDARAGSSSHFVAKNLIVGNNSSFNQLLIPGGVVVAAGDNVLVGRDPVTSINNLLIVTGGTLRVPNPGTLLDVRGGTIRLDAGLVDVDGLIITNTRGQFEFNGGTLRTHETTIANGRVFTVGNGTSLATLQLFGGTHSFSNNLVIANNASLIGNGVIEGTITVSAGGKLIPGAPIGRIDVLGTVILQGAANVQIDKSGGLLTNDQVTASGATFYGGTLNVTDIGTDDLAAGDRFPLFSATPYVGAFTTISLPPLDPGLDWTNKLSLDGSIEVVAISASQPRFSGINVSGTNVILSGTNGTPNTSYALLTATNVALPRSNWASIFTNHFDSGGGFSFTNGVIPGIPQRFFQLRTP